MPKMMTPEQSFNLSMNEYPSLYTDAVLEQAKLKYYNHIFNVIGNGYRDVDEFVQAHTITKKNKNLIDSFPDKYITSEALYEAYTEIDETRSYPVGKRNSELPGLYTERELKNMPEVKYTMQVNKSHRRENFVPYPNFKKEHSIMWKDVNLDKSWFEEACFFYTKCKEFFASEHVHRYHNAMPLEENANAWERLIDDYESNFVRLKTPDMTQEAYYQAITKAYNSEYSGDTKEFIKNKWKKEHARINVFIDETLERLESLINAQKPKIKNNKR